MNPWYIEFFNADTHEYLFSIKILVIILFLKLLKITTKEKNNVCYCY